MTLSAEGTENEATSHIQWNPDLGLFTIDREGAEIYYECLRKEELYKQKYLEEKEAHTETIRAAERAEKAYKSKLEAAETKRRRNVLAVSASTFAAGLIGGIIIGLTR